MENVRLALSVEEELRNAKEKNKEIINKRNICFQRLMRESHKKMDYQIELCVKEISKIPGLGAIVEKTSVGLLRIKFALSIQKLERYRFEEVDDQCDVLVKLYNHCRFCLEFMDIVEKVRNHCDMDVYKFMEGYERNGETIKIE